MRSEKQHLRHKCGSRHRESANSDERHRADTALKNFDEIITTSRPKVEERAEELHSSYERLRRAIKGHRIKVEPIFPPDVLSVSVVLPQPKM